MRNRTGVMLLAFGLAGTAGAASQRTFVASYGVDTNSCSLTQPCRQFARALTQTLPGGEIIVLDSAGYGAVDIAQDVSIIAPAGIYAGVSVFTGKGVSIHPGATKVKLRGLTINGQGGVTGIFSDAGAAVIDIADCEVSGMVAEGVWIIGNAKLTISDTRFLNNGSWGIQYAGGIPSGSGVISLERVVLRGNGSAIGIQAATASINASTFERNTSGGISGLYSYINVRDSIVTNNGGSGIDAFDGYLRVERSTLSVNGGWGIKLENTAQAWLVQNAIYDNQQASAGTSQVCACDAGTTAYLSGNAMHGTVLKAVDAVGPVYTFGDNPSVKFWIGTVNAVSPQ